MEEASNMQWSLNDDNSSYTTDAISQSSEIDDPFHKKYEVCMQFVFLL